MTSMFLRTLSALAGVALLSGPGTSAAATFTYTDPACTSFTSTVSGTGDLNVTCGNSTPPTQGVPQCSLVATPSSIASGGQSVLNAICSPSATSFAWTNTTSSTSSSTVSPTATTTYTVRGSNASGAGNTASVTVTVASTTPPPTTSGDCLSQGLSNADHAFDWGGGYLKDFLMVKGQSHTFGFNPVAGGAGRFSTVYGGTPKIMSISTKQCDFSQTLASSKCLTAGSDPSISYSTTSPRYACLVTPGTQYYLNIRNAILGGDGMPIYPIQDSCTGISCHFSITY